MAKTERDPEGLIYILQEQNEIFESSKMRENGLLEKWFHYPTFFLYAQ